VLRVPDLIIPKYSDRTFENGTIVPGSKIVHVLLVLEHLRFSFNEEILLGFRNICEGIETRFKGWYAERALSDCITFELLEKQPDGTYKVPDDIRQIILTLTEVRGGALRILEEEGLDS